MLTNPRDAFRGQSRSPNIVPFHMLATFPLCNSNFVFKKRRFYNIRLQKISWPWNSGQRSLNVIESGTILQWCSPRDQGLGLEAPRGQKWKSWSWTMESWSWSWSWTFGLGVGLGLEEKLLHLFKTFVVILDGSEQGTPWHFVRDNKISLPFGIPLFERTVLHAHQPQLRGYLTMGAIFRPHRRQ